MDILEALRGDTDYTPIKAPFPWFGGKSRIADAVWSRLGDVTNYVEPFFGSGAVLLSRPAAGKIETVNDKDAMLANFWRATKAAPDQVAQAADWPVNEADLAARHAWLVTEGAARLAQHSGDPYYYNAEIAGWWVWGACAWIGSGWCSGRGPWSWDAEAPAWVNRKMPHVGDAGPGIYRQRPHVSDAGQGINRQMPHVGNAGQGINRQMPHVGNAGRGEFIADWLAALALRLRDVRVCCGDWSRVCGTSVTHRQGLTGVFLDPPYADTAGRTPGLYATDSLTVAHEARKWAIEEGRNTKMRIVLAGYEGEHIFPDDWSCVAWKAKGGYAAQGGRGRDNATRERLWFSPHCLSVAANV